MKVGKVSRGSPEGVDGSPNLEMALSRVVKDLSRAVKSPTRIVKGLSGILESSSRTVRDPEWAVKSLSRTDQLASSTDELVSRFDQLGSRPVRGVFRAAAAVLRTLTRASSGDFGVFRTASGVFRRDGRAYRLVGSAARLDGNERRCQPASWASQSERLQPDLRNGWVFMPCSPRKRYAALPIVAVSPV
jgi:hypothetical protein